MKLIKDHSEYMLIDKDRNLIGTTDKSILEVIDKMKLSKQNCDELFGVVDVYNYYPRDPTGVTTGVVVATRKGFTKAMELNKDKVFTLEDIKRAISFGQGMDLWKEEEQISKFIQSLHQPTEIDVVIVMEYQGKVELSKYHELEPKLDSEGCLILKKI
jgi:hypothetical protein